MEAKTGEAVTHARFPELSEKAGHYESFYIKACRPGGGLGVWIRHTVHKRPGSPPTASLWFTLFDRDAAGPLATKVTVPSPELSAGDGAYIRIGESWIGPGRAVGSARTPALEASWDLTFSGDTPPFFHLPRGWMYRAPVPRTKLLSPHPNVRYSGVVQAGERTVELDGWPGMVGHNWGAEHAQRWIWMHGAGFEGAADAWLDAGLGRIKLGPFTTPWLGNALLHLDGSDYRLGGPERVRSTEVEDSPAGCRFTLPGKEATVRGQVSAPPKEFVAWVYADPDGSEHNTLNCSVADMELTVEREGEPPRTLSVPGGAAYEIGMRETDHGVPLQPYPDGQ